MYRIFYFGEPSIMDMHNGIYCRKLYFSVDTLNPEEWYTNVKMAQVFPKGVFLDMFLDTLGRLYPDYVFYLEKVV